MPEFLTDLNLADTLLATQFGLCVLIVLAIQHAEARNPYQVSKLVSAIGVLSVVNFLALVVVSAKI